nr:hypothetical protein [Salinispora arenicola]
MPAASAVRWRRLAAAAVVAVLGVAGVVALSPPLPAAAVADPLPCAAEAADVSQAAEMAERCGSPVEALSERTEKNRLTVEPGGHGAVRRGDGADAGAERRRIVAGRGYVVAGWWAGGLGGSGGDVG